VHHPTAEATAAAAALWQPQQQRSNPNYHKNSDVAMPSDYTIAPWVRSSSGGGELLGLQHKPNSNSCHHTNSRQSESNKTRQRVLQQQYRRAKFQLLLNRGEATPAVSSLASSTGPAELDSDASDDDSKADKVNHKYTRIKT
jgi:hypothetical protein